MLPVCFIFPFTLYIITADADNGMAHLVTFIHSFIHCISALLMIITFHHCTNLLYPARLFISC